MRTRVGYAGGVHSAPTYDDLFDHSEAIEIVYDPAVITYDDLLAEFWSHANPTVPSYGVQYRSAIFVHDAAERAAAERSLEAHARTLSRPILTKIEDAGTFWVAEDYHQKYRLRHSPLMADFAKMYSVDADFVASTAAARANALVAGHGDPACIDQLGLSPASVAWIRQR